MTAGQRCLTLLKGRHRFVFTYADGLESAVLATFVALANDPESEFDWFDAAALSFRLGHSPRTEDERIARAVMGQEI